jgi:tRNA(Ile)-lysidine synthase
MQLGFSQNMNGPGQYDFSTFELGLSLEDVPPAADAGPFPGAANTIWLDAGTIKWPLSLRFWKHGDRFHPLGLAGSKKLQDFFVDSRVHRGERGRVPLLCDQEKIIWIVGYRLDDRVKVTPRTERILIIEKRDRALKGGF